MEQFILVIIDELLLDGAVAALGAGGRFVRIIPDTNPLRGLRAISLPSKWWASGDKSASGSCRGHRGVAGSVIMNSEPLSSILKRGGFGSR